MDTGPNAEESEPVVPVVEEPAETPEEAEKRKRWNDIGQEQVVEIILPTGAAKIAKILENAKDKKFGFKVKHAILETVGQEKALFTALTETEVDVDSVRKLDPEELDKLKLEAAGGKGFSELVSEVMAKLKEVQEGYGDFILKHSRLGQDEDMQKLAENVRVRHEALKRAVAAIKQGELDAEALRDLERGKIPNYNYSGGELNKSDLVYDLQNALFSLSRKLDNVYGNEKGV